MTHHFQIETTVNAFFDSGHVHLAPGSFSTEDPKLAAFLKRYPGVKFLTTEKKPVPSPPVQSCPVRPAVFRGMMCVGDDVVSE
jgi:hypothetical protein